MQDPTRPKRCSLCARDACPALLPQGPVTCRARQGGPEDIVVDCRQTAHRRQPGAKGPCAGYSSNPGRAPGCSRIRGSDTGGEQVHQVKRGRAEQHDHTIIRAVSPNYPFQHAEVHAGLAHLGGARTHGCLHTWHEASARRRLP